MPKRIDYNAYLPCIADAFIKRGITSHPQIMEKFKEFAKQKWVQDYFGDNMIGERSLYHLMLKKQKQSPFHIRDGQEDKPTYTPAAQILSYLLETTEDELFGLPPIYGEEDSKEKTLYSITQEFTTQNRSPDQDLIDSELYKTVDTLLQTQIDIRRDVVKGLYFDQLTIEELSKKLSITPERVKVIEDLVLTKLNNDQTKKSLGDDWERFSTKQPDYRAIIFERTQARAEAKRDHYAWLKEHNIPTPEDLL